MFENFQELRPSHASTSLSIIITLSMIISRANRKIGSKAFI
jgi:hypothetical protein